MSIWKDWRVWLFIIIVLASIAAIGPNPWAKGVEVSYVDENSPFKGEILVGEKISSIGIEGGENIPIDSPEDMIQFQNYTGVLRVFHQDGLTLKSVEDGNLGFEVKEIGTSNLNLGMDLRGGTRVLLKPELNQSLNQTFTIDQIISTLQTRMNVYGLKEMNFQAVEDVEGNEYVQIEMAGVSKQEIYELLEKQGMFEAYIPRMVHFINDTGEIEIGNESFEVQLMTELNTTSNETTRKVAVNEKEVGINQTVSLNKIDFKVWNITNTTAVLAGKTFTTEDIKYVYFDSQHAYIRQYGDGWEFAFQILISDEGSQRFAKITEDIPVVIDPKTGESYLEQKIYLFLDDVLMDSLRISGGLAGEAYSNPQITGGGQTERDASISKRRLQSVLSSGALPVNLEVVRMDSISPSLGTSFLNGILFAGLGAILSVSIVVFVRYRKWKIVLPIIITSLSEIIIILGVASAIKWTIDLAAIAGIIAAVGTGVDHQIIITDEISLQKEVTFSMKEKIKRAFFIIFGTASTTIAAMIPLGVIGIGVMRGFAITTIIGILVGIFITRPTYSRIIEELDIL